jgi:LmbE family N-acetylglucosaminyl deacetylase
MTIDPWRHHQLHPDHRAAGQAALDAIYASREWHIFPEQLVGEVEPWRVKEVYLFWTGDADYWEDVSLCIEARIAALGRHATQVGLDTEKLAERIRKRTQEAGKEAGCEYAEEFKLIQF